MSLGDLTPTQANEDIYFFTAHEGNDLHEANTVCPMGRLQHPCISNHTYYFEVVSNTG